VYPQVQCPSVGKERDLAGRRDGSLLDLTSRVLTYSKFETSTAAGIPEVRFACGGRGIGESLTVCRTLWSDRDTKTSSAKEVGDEEN